MASTQGRVWDADDPRSPRRVAEQVGFLKRTDDITYDVALGVIQRHRERSPDIAPEVAAVVLLRQIDSWEEHRAILKALDTVIAEQS